MADEFELASELRSSTTIVVVRFEIPGARSYNGRKREWSRGKRRGLGNHGRQ
jgi:hypothetical protein